MTQNQAEKRYGNGTLPTDQPNPEVLLQAKRRTFTVNYKQWLLEEVDKCREQSGQIGALLRREGLHTSHLTTWRRQREGGESEARTISCLTAANRPLPFPTHPAGEDGGVPAGAKPIPPTA